ncbi:MAG: hypothetical protein EA362_04775 [Saprospirales bacterium]|nr:MAG: hypothetical protein EA362_04775 [Saprospirales bacterium]
MTGKIFRDAFLLVGAFIIAWLVFSYLSKPVSIPDQFIPDEQTEKLADWIDEQITRNFDRLDDHNWEEALGEIVDRFATSDLVNKVNYEIVVLDNSDVNAFATLGTRIYVFRGLLELIDQHEEIAAVIAHEIAHVELNHVEQKLITEFGIVVLLSVFTGGDLLLTGEVLRAISSGAFSRMKEREADAFALDLMYDTGIDPAYLGIVFRKLKESEPGLSGLNFQIISTHPDINSRIRNAFEFEKSGLEDIPFETPWPGKSSE